MKPWEKKARTNERPPAKACLSVFAFVVLRCLLSLSHQKQRRLCCCLLLSQHSLLGTLSLFLLCYVAGSKEETHWDFCTAEGGGGTTCNEKENQICRLHSGPGFNVVLRVYKSLSSPRVALSPRTGLRERENGDMRSCAFRKTDSARNLEVYYVLYIIHSAYVGRFPGICTTRSRTFLCIEDISCL